MKTIKQGIIVIVALLFASAIQTFAIERLQISVQCSNVALSWPSQDGETYIVQYRPDLTSTNPWITLTNEMPPDPNTNITFFVHSNIVQHPNCGNGGGSTAAMMSSGGSSASLQTALNSGVSLGMARVAMLLSQTHEPLAMLKDDWGSLVPVAIYPSGFDFTGFLIFDPSSGEWIEGASYMTQAAILKATLSLNGAQFDGPNEPGGADTDDPDVNSEPETGFYRVVRHGAHLFELTNSTSFSGLMAIPVETGNDSGALVNLSIVENGSPVSDVSIQLAPFRGRLYVPVDTTQMTNGTHDIFAHAVWQVTTGTNEQDTYSVEADSPPVTVNVFNEISFPNWMSSFGELGDTLLITAQSAHTNTDWLADVYGANAGYIGTFSGHTDDGSIYGVWDLTGPPPDNISYTNEPWFQFKVSTPYIDPLSPKTYKQTDPWAGPGDWVMAAQHAWDSVVGHEDLYDELDGYVGLAQGLGLTVRPSPDSSGHAFTLHVADPSDPQPTYDWTGLRQALYDLHSRNFLYMGHGGPDGLGINRDHTNHFIPATEIASVLHTIPTGQTNRHAFRMVILDGCSTAPGTLPEAFGIPHKENVPETDSLNASMRPTAFVGWSADKYISIQSGGLNYDHIHFIQWIAYFLSQGEGIKQAIDDASRQADVNDGYVHHNEFKVFGDPLLTFFGYNN